VTSKPAIRPFSESKDLKWQIAISKPDSAAERVERKILLIRGQRVMLDSDLAELYCVQTKFLNRAVRRNLERFPEDFMFQLTQGEFEALRFHSGTSNLRSQIATPKAGRGGRRYRPYAFTEHGAVMLASVLNSPVAVHASVQVVRAFIRLREMLATNKELARKLTELEARIAAHDENITALFEAIRKLTEPPERPHLKIGFRSSEASR